MFLYAIYGPATDFGEVSRAVIFHQVRKYLLRLDEREDMSVKFWRPSPLFVATQVCVQQACITYLKQSSQFLTRGEENLARLADSMKKGGLYILSSFVFGEFSEESLAARAEQVVSTYDGCLVIEQ